MNNQHALVLRKKNLSGLVTTLEQPGQETNKDQQQSIKEARKRILVVDDSKDARESTAALLRELGHEVDTAGDGTSALSKALEFRPYAVLIDIVMPGISGFKVSEQLRSHALLNDTLLITVTGWDEDMDPWLSKHAGCDYHLSKPLNVTLLETYLKQGRKRMSEA